MHMQLARMVQNEWLANEPANSDAPLSTPGKIHHSCSSQILALSSVTCSSIHHLLENVLTRV
jgi:hypothetical protein